LEAAYSTLRTFATVIGFTTEELVEAVVEEGEGDGEGKEEEDLFCPFVDLLVFGLVIFGVSDDLRLSLGLEERRGVGLGNAARLLLRGN